MASSSWTVSQGSVANSAAQGRVLAGPRECGGLRLEGTTSALPEITFECNEVRPFESRFAQREQPRAWEAELLKQVRAEPALSVQPVDSGVPEFKGPTPARWSMLYTFDSDRGDGPSLQGLVALVQAATRDRAPSIVVHGYRAASRLDNGEIMEEQAGMAKQRAQKIARTIAGLGYPAASLRVFWTEETARGDGQTDWTKRRVIVEVKIDDAESPGLSGQASAWPHLICANPDFVVRAPMRAG
jgi:hypothetical protein